MNRRISHKTRQPWNDPTHAHFLTYSCYRRLPLLTRDRTRQWVIDAFANLRAKHDVAIYAYVIMPEHVHVLLHPRDLDIRRVLVALKQPVAKRAHTWLRAQNETDWLRKLTVTYPSRTVFRFWQPGGGYDRNIFQHKSLPALIEYIHANPVRRGLAKDPTTWTWSSAQAHAGLPNAMLAVDNPFE